MTYEEGVSERIYRRLKAALLSGTLNPYIRLDFAEIAEQSDVSTTPVREAAMRLLGEGLLEFHAKGGTRPHLASELRLRTLLDLHANLSLFAIDWAASAIAAVEECDVHDSYEMKTRRFFRGLSQATGNPEFTEIIERLSDRLAPFRHQEETLIVDAARELRELRAAVRDLTRIRRLLRTYHRRRNGLVPQLVSMTNAAAHRAEA